MQIARIKLVSWVCNGKANGAHSGNGQYPYFIDPDSLEQNNFRCLGDLFGHKELIAYLQRYGLQAKPPRTINSLINGIFDAFCHAKQLAAAKIPRTQIPGRRLTALLDLKRLLLEKRINVEEIICTRNTRETKALWHVIDNGLKEILADKSAPRCFVTLGIQPAQVAQFASENMRSWLALQIQKAKPGFWQNYLKAIDAKILSFTEASRLYWHCPFSAMLFPGCMEETPAAKSSARCKPAM